MAQAGRPHALLLRRGCSHLAGFLNSILNRNLFVCLCTGSMLFIWLSVLRQLAKLFRTTLGAVRTSCVFGDIRVLNSKLFTVTGWVFRQWLDPRRGYLHEDSAPLHDFLPFPEFHACGQWCHVMLYNYVLLHVKCHKTHMQSEGGVDIFL